MGHGAWELRNRALYRAGKKEPAGRGVAYGERGRRTEERMGRERNEDLKCREEKWTRGKRRGR